MNTQMQKRIRWERGLFRIYVLWILLSIPFAWWVSREIYSECQNEASQYREQADKIAATFPSDDKRYYGVTNWADKAENFSNPEWCSTRANLFSDPTWYETQIQLLQQHIDQIRSRNTLEWKEDHPHSAPGDWFLEFETEALQAEIEKFSNAEWRALQARKLATPEWRQEQASTAKEKSSRIISSEAGATRLDTQAPAVALKAGFITFAVTAFIPWVIHYVIKFLGLWIILGFVGESSGVQRAEDGKGRGVGPR
jgi:hypothetical protein